MSQDKSIPPSARSWHPGRSLQAPLNSLTVQHKELLRDTADVAIREWRTKQFNDELDAGMKAQGLATDTELRRFLDVSNGLITHWRNGEYDGLSIRKAVRVFALLGRNVGALFNETAKSRAVMNAVLPLMLQWPVQSNELPPECALWNLNELKQVENVSQRIFPEKHVLENDKDFNVFLKTVVKEENEAYEKEQKEAYSRFSDPQVNGIQKGGHTASPLQTKGEPSQHNAHKIAVGALYWHALKRLLQRAGLLLSIFFFLAALYSSLVRFGEEVRPNPNVVAQTKSAIVTIKVPRSGMKDLIGTGVIVDESGLIITNRHVVVGSDKVSIVLYDKTELKGDVIKSDAITGLAIIRVKTSKVTTIPLALKAMPLAPFHDQKVGETVIAVGHPFGYTNTVCTGVITALDCELMPAGTVRSLLKIKAHGKWGSPGMPVTNQEGRVVGILVTFPDQQSYIYAMPANRIRQWLRQATLLNQEK